MRKQRISRTGDGSLFDNKKTYRTSNQYYDLDVQVYDNTTDNFVFKNEIKDYLQKIKDMNIWYEDSIDKMDRTIGNKR